MKTMADFERGVTFSNYYSFFLVKGNSSGDLLIDQRAADDVKSALSSRGWVEVPEGEGHVAVVLHATTPARHTHEALYDRWGGWDWNRGWDDNVHKAAPFVADYKVGTLVVDMFDANSKQAIWHGYASHAVRIEPRSSARASEAAVDRMFHSFPPPSGAPKGR